MPHTFKFIVAFVFCMVMYSGCSYNPGPNSMGPGKTIPAKAGSTYNFKTVQTDTTGKPIDSTTRYSRDSVVSSGQDTLGKTNVTHFVSIDTVYGYTYNDTYINFEANGDLSFYQPGGGLGGVTLPDWRTYPMQSHTTIGAKVGDTTITFPGIPVPISLTAFDSLFYVASGAYSAGTTSIPVFNLKEVITVNATILFSPVKFTPTRHISFAPSLGYIVADTADPVLSTVAVIPSSGGSIKTLVSYKLK